jgi:hypothetical protein
MCSKFLLISLAKFCYKKEARGNAKVIRKKREEKELRKNGQVSDILKTMGTQMPA